jgi:hypothetical protein
MERIFVSIASYRDPETGPTIKNLFDQAEFGQRVYVGLCLQQEKNEIYIPENKNIKILEYNWRESQGTCWARHNIQKLLYDGEDYYLQLDSHHRFCKNWDSLLVKIIKELKTRYEKPIVGGYCPSYKPNNDKNLEDKPMKINSLSDFTDLGDLMFIPKIIKNFKELQNKNELAIPARFLSGHFIFSEGIFCIDCIYDPTMYFRGEELSLSARAYTNGYDMFHPTVPIVWHEYIREGQIKHWDDHTTKNGFLTNWQNRSDKGKERARILLGIQKNNKIKFGKYGLGNKRSLHEYELYAGLNFETKQVHKHAYDINNVYPNPSVLDEKEWLSGLMPKYKMSIDIPNEYLKEISAISDNLKHISIICENKNKICCYRQDIKKHNLHTISSKYYIEASMESEPYSISLTPYEQDKGFLQKYQIINFRLYS